MNDIKRTITAILLIILFGSAILCGAEHVIWKANWIGLADSSQPNTWLCYRKRINISENVKKAEALILL